MNNELKWVIDHTSVVKEYPNECVEKSFKGKITYKMAMAIILKNEWEKVDEYSSHLWYASKMNMGLSYNEKTGILDFTMTVAI